jgi:hypothetical protein
LKYTGEKKRVAVQAVKKSHIWRRRPGPILQVDGCAETGDENDWASLYRVG